MAEGNPPRDSLSASWVLGLASALWSYWLSAYPYGGECFCVTAGVRWSAAAGPATPPSFTRGGTVPKRTVARLFSKQKRGFPGGVGDIEIGPRWQKYKSAGS